MKSFAFASSAITLAATLFALGLQGAHAQDALLQGVPASNDQCEKQEDFRSGLKQFTAGDYVLAAQTFAPLAQSGDPCSEYWLGKMYHLGEGVTRDDAKYVELIKASAAQGYSRARAEMLVLPSAAVGN